MSVCLSYSHSNSLNWHWLGTKLKDLKKSYSFIWWQTISIFSYNCIKFNTVYRLQKFCLSKRVKVYMISCVHVADNIMKTTSHFKTKNNWIYYYWKVWNFYYNISRNKNLSHSNHKKFIGEVFMNNNFFSLGNLILYKVEDKILSSCKSFWFHVIRFNFYWYSTSNWSDCSCHWRQFHTISMAKHLRILIVNFLCFRNSKRFASKL